MQQANGNLIWESGDHNRVVSVPEDAPVDSMLVSVCAFNIIDDSSTPQLQPITAEVMELLEEQRAGEAAAEEAQAAAEAEEAAAAAEQARAGHAAAAVAKALATMGKHTARPCSALHEIPSALLCVWSEENGCSASQPQAECRPGKFLTGVSALGQSNAISDDA